MSRKYWIVAAIAVLSLRGGHAHAGASLFVDDAAITPADHCQVESWLRMRAPGHEFTAVPACNIVGTEFGLGFSHSPTPQRVRLWTVGAKRLIRDFATGTWGLGVSAGAAWDGDRRRWTGWSVNAPASVALDENRRWALHANLGWNEPRAQRGALTGGIGIEFAATKRWSVLAELYGEHRGTAAGQAGVRRAVGHAGALDLLVGHQTGPDAQTWLTLGVNLAFSR